MTIKYWCMHKTIVGSANALTELIFQNEELFMEKFCRSKYIDLLDVYFSGLGVKFYYIDCEGQEFTDEISNADLQQWLLDLE